MHTSLATAQSTQAEAEATSKTLLNYHYVQQTSSLSHEHAAARARIEQLQIRRESQIDNMIHFVRKGLCDHVYWDIGVYVYAISAPFTYC
jgi:hypothetical protein